MSMPTFLEKKISSAPYTELIPPPSGCHFLTFATTNWVKSIERARRLCGTIRDRFGYFATESILSENDLPATWFDITSKVGRDYGYGYWSWKPVIVCDSLDRIDTGETLLYLDGGCRMPESYAGMIDFLSCISVFAAKMKDGDVGLSLPTYQSVWFNTPRCAASLDILRFFGLESDFNFIDRFPHWEAGAMLIRKTRETVDLMKVWRDTMLDNLPDLFAHRDVGLPGFVHNSADQSILQCLLYLNKTRIVNANGLFYGRNVYVRDRG